MDDTAGEHHATSAVEELNAKVKHLEDQVRVQ
jgi:outer membrane murein-binding lipoprotein Lpp